MTAYADPVKQNLVVNKGADFNAVFVAYDAAGAAIDLSTYTAHLEMRATPFDAPFLKLTSEALPPAGFSNYITLGTADGKITLAIPASVTEAIVPDYAYYDIKLTSGGGAVTRFMQGRVRFARQVTTD